MGASPVQVIRREIRDQNRTPTTYKSADLGSSPTARGLEWSAVGCLVGVNELASWVF